MLNTKQFSQGVDCEFGNYDFLIACDLDTSHPEVVAELEHWGRWFYDQFKPDGFRLDAVKHIEASFYRDWLKHIRAHAGKNLFAVGEYLSYDLSCLRKYLTAVDNSMALFDFPLRSSMVKAGREGADFDLRTIFDDSLVVAAPEQAVTLVDSHDTQPGQDDYAVPDWFRPLAYALILLRQGGYPCVFWGDYYGASYPEGKLTSHRWILDRMLECRRDYGHGPQLDFFPEPRGHRLDPPRGQGAPRWNGGGAQLGRRGLVADADR